MKKLNVCLYSLLALFLFSGCIMFENDMNPLTAEQFKTIMEEKGLAINDQTEALNDPAFQNAYVAFDEEKYSFEYYVMNSEIYAENVYNHLVERAKAAYKGKNGAVIKSFEGISKDSFEASAPDFYYVKAIRLQNTVFYVTAYSDSKDEAIQLIKELGYK